MRIDRFLRQEWPNAPLSVIQKLLRTGQVRLNGGRIRGNARLRAGDLVRLPPVAFAEENRSTPPVPPKQVGALGERILHRDARLLILNKPSGIPVHGGSGQPWGVVDAMRLWWTGQGAGAGVPELCHRLDRETSGCLVFGLDKPALRQVAEAFRSGAVHKRYLALVKGTPPADAGEVKAPLAKGTTRDGERMVASAREGRPARTRYRVLSRFGGASLVEAVPDTGRTHQIRVHMQLLGCPLAGDGKYGERPFNRALRKWGLRRLFLHAAQVALPHPDGGRTEVEAPLDDDLETVLERIRKGVVW